jgi:hypothetical protein
VAIPGTLNRGSSYASVCSRIPIHLFMTANGICGWGMSLKQRVRREITNQEKQLLSRFGRWEMLGLSMFLI